MKKQKKISLYAGIGLLAVFAVWTVLVRFIDVRSIGPEGSFVGFAAINAWVHELTGVHLGLYLFIDWVSILPFLLIFGFGLLGLIQWIKRKSFVKVDYDILVLGFIINREECIRIVNVFLNQVTRGEVLLFLAVGLG